MWLYSVGKKVIKDTNNSTPSRESISFVVIFSYFVRFLEIGGVIFTVRGE